MTVFMTPMSRMCREKAADLKKVLDEETDERRALTIARIALSWLELAESEERKLGVIEAHARQTRGGDGGPPPKSSRG